MCFFKSRTERDIQQLSVPTVNKFVHGGGPKNDRNVCNEINLCNSNKYSKSDTEQKENQSFLCFTQVFYFSFFKVCGML